MRVRESTSGASASDAAAFPQPNAKRRIADRYDVIAELGRGGVACVLHVIETATGRELALKRLLPQADIELERDSASRFEHEFHALAQLAHPRVIQVYDFGVDASGPYYTMELLDGRNLETDQRVPWQRTCALLCDVASTAATCASSPRCHGAKRAS
jgi:serine/threonine protein kinase